MRMLFLICLSYVLAACASRDVRCDGTLRTINPPASSEGDSAITPETNPRTP